MTNTQDYSIMLLITLVKSSIIQVPEQLGDEAIQKGKTSDYQGLITR